MNYFSFLYQCNMIRVFPLCAGVIGAQLVYDSSPVGVSPVWGLSAHTEKAPRPC